jgi:hypothetical protein
VTICDIYVTHEVAVGHEVTVGDSNVTVEPHIRDLPFVCPPLGRRRGQLQVVFVAILLSIICTSILAVFLNASP